jgi:hypothetical protein
VTPDPLQLFLGPLTWLVAAVSASALATNWLWTLEMRGPRNSLEERLAQLSGSPRALAAVRAALSAVPLVLASWLRVVEPAALGLAAPRSIPGAALAALFTIIALAWMALVRGAFARAVGTTRTKGRAPLTFRSAEAILLTAAGLEAYWAFVRGAILSVGLASGTLAVFLALGILGLQGLASPNRREQLGDSTGAASLARGATGALLSAMVFLASGSIVLCFAAHALLALGYVSLGLEAAPAAVPRAEPEPDPIQVEPTIV